MSKKFIITIIIISLLIAIPVFCQIFVLNNNGGDLLPKDRKLREADYVNAYCKGIVEYRLPDKTRVDCLTDEYAIEFDWAKKWAESIGQSIYYAKMTGKKPAVAIIMKSPKDERYIKRIEKTDLGIKIFRIKAY